MASSSLSSMGLQHWFSSNRQAIWNSVGVASLFLAFDFASRQGCSLTWRLISTVSRLREDLLRPVSANAVRTSTAPRCRIPRHPAVGHRTILHRGSTIGFCKEGLGLLALARSLGVASQLPERLRGVAPDTAPLNLAPAKDLGDTITATTANQPSQHLSMACAPARRLHPTCRPMSDTCECLRVPRQIALDQDGARAGSPFFCRTPQFLAPAWH